MSSVDLIHKLCQFFKIDNTSENLTILWKIVKTKKDYANDIFENFSQKERQLILLLYFNDIDDINCYPIFHDIDNDRYNNIKNYHKNNK